MFRFLIAIALVAAGGTFSMGAEVLRPLWTAPLKLNSPTNVVVGRHDGRALLCVQGTRSDLSPHAAGIEVIDAAGKHVWEDPFAAKDGANVGAYVQWIGGNDPLVAYSFVPDEAEAPGGARILRAADGTLVKQIANTTHFGNNNSLMIDLTGDDVPEFVYADLNTLTAFQVPAFTPLWRHDEGIVFCWSLPAAADVTGDDVPEIIFGSEYNNADESSSMVALDRHGKAVWRKDGFAEDLGSTPVLVADIDGDGRDELLKVGLDLEHRRKQQWNHVHVFRADGSLVRQIPVGFTGIAIGAMKGNGHVQGVGISNTRDGGLNGAKAIRCLDLVTGDVEWSVDVPRAYLDCNSPVMADFDDDGALEAVVGTGNPAGYARLPDSEPWGDLYVVSANGEIEQRLELPGWPVNLAFCDINDDGLGEIIAVLDGLPGSLACYATKAPTKRIDWPTPFGDAKRQGTMALK